MKYPIYVYGSSVLRKGTEEITKDYENLNLFVDDLFETMYASDGVGLAAPQIGKSNRIFVIDTTHMADDDEEKIKRAFLNAHIYERTGEEVYFEEGCLSLPGIHEDVLRHDTIKIRYVDENFEPHDETFTGTTARVIQHEYDHLDGLLYIDHLSPLRKRLIKSKLDKIAKGDFKSTFPCKLVK